VLFDVFPPVVRYGAGVTDDCPTTGHLALYGIREHALT
jgi:hypothetical protein